MALSPACSTLFWPPGVNLQPMWWFSPNHVQILTTPCSDSHHTMCLFSLHHGDSYHTMVVLNIQILTRPWSRLVLHTVLLQKPVYFAQQWLGLQREVTTKNDYKSLCNNLQIIYMKDLGLVRCFYFHENNNTPHSSLCVYKWLFIKQNLFNSSKNTSWVKTQVIKNKKLEMITPGADGLMAWASNAITLTKYN